VSTASSLGILILRSRTWFWYEIRRQLFDSSKILQDTRTNALSFDRAHNPYNCYQSHYCFLGSWKRTDSGPSRQYRVGFYNTAICCSVSNATTTRTLYCTEVPLGRYSPENDDRILELKHRNIHCFLQVCTAFSKELVHALPVRWESIERIHDHRTFPVVILDFTMNQDQFLSWKLLMNSTDPLSGIVSLRQTSLRGYVINIQLWL
jgi:hypothetical protein